MASIARNAALDDAHVGDIRGALGTIPADDSAPRAGLSAKLKTLLAIVGPGDCVLFFTDGLTEARREKDQFGSERVAETLAGAPHDAKGVVAAMQQAVLSFAEGALGDDLAILVLRVRPDA